MLRPVIFFLAALASCACQEEQKWYYPDHEYDRTPLGDAVDKASMKLLKESYAQSADKNVIEAPIGLFTLLALYSSASEGPVREEIVRALGSENYDQLSTYYQTLGQRFSSLDPTFLALANKVFVSNAYTLQDGFRHTAVESFRSDVEAVNFQDTKAAAEAINKWSDEKTKGLIKNPVGEDDLSTDTAAALVNVIFFQGHWGVPFNASLTEEKDFHVDKDTVVKKPTMTITQSLFYRDSEELGAKLVELPYKEKNFRMVVFLPNEVDGLSSLLEKVADKGVLTEVFKLEPAGAEVILEMPKFEIKSRHDFTRILPKVGVSKMFSEPVSGVLQGQSVKIDKAFQEALVKVDEEGATAAAFTGAIAVAVSDPPVYPEPITFKVDHPFLFAILHQDIVLFAGTYIH